MILLKVINKTMADFRADSSSGYVIPKSKKKGAKKEKKEGQSTNNIENISKYHQHHHTISGVFWGGSVWLRDEQDIRILSDNGCYGNSVMDRHSAGSKTSDTLSSADNDALNGCGQTKPLVPCDTSPPNKRAKVVEDSDSEAIDTPTLDTPLLNLISNMRSCHVLLLEEAFYLVKRSCLQVTTVYSDTVLTEDEVWLKMAESDPKFAIKYSSYEYFRNNGWVPKCGIKFGADFVLYESGGPTASHATFSVIVIENNDRKYIENKTTSGSQEVMSCNRLQSPTAGSTKTISSTASTGTSSLGGSSNDELKTRPTWLDVLSLGRVNEGAKKDVAICYVSKQEDNSGKQCATAVKRVVVVKRWLLTKERL